MGNIELGQMECIEDDFFRNNPVHLKFDLEGQGINLKGEYVLGCRAGPEVSLTNLLHEMAHLADMKIKNLLAYPTCGWGYITGEQWQIGNQCGIEPKNYKGLLTEIRCYGYQISLINEYKREMKSEEVYDLVKPVRFLPCFDLFKNEFNIVDDKEAIHSIALAAKTKSLTTHRIKSFRKAWNKRMEALKANPKGKS